MKLDLTMMKRNSRSFSGIAVPVLIASLLAATVPLVADAAELNQSSPRALVIPDANASFRNEVQRAIDRGLAWLQAAQNSNGWWATPDHPAQTALALSAFKGDPRRRYSTDEPPWLQKGYAYLRACVQPDGGIHRTQLVTYNTSISMMALMASGRREYDPVLVKARQFLVGLQCDFGEKGKADDIFDGGIGYGSQYDHSDMGNTTAALEALRVSRSYLADRNVDLGKDLNWEAAIQFLENCQNLAACNKQAWVSEDPADKGGFVYYPGHSMAGGVTNSQTGRVALRSYGSISYAGLLSYIYAGLKKNDPRVQAVHDWLRANYTLDENPAMGQQGYFYYLHTMAKALNAQGVTQLDLARGGQAVWRRDVAQKLFNLQRPDGSWVNANGRWWENDPILVTCYAVLTLEMVNWGL